MTFRREAVCCVFFSCRFGRSPTLPYFAAPARPLCSFQSSPAENTMKAPCQRGFTRVGPAQRVVPVEPADLGRRERPRSV